MLRIKKWNFPQTLVLQATALAFYILMGIFFAKFWRPDGALLASLGGALFTDLLLSRLLKKEIHLPIGAFIAGSSLFLLLQGKSFVPYLIAAVLSQVGKKLFVVNSKAIFNPSNLGLICAVYLVPNLAGVIPGQWHNSLIFLVSFYGIGIFVSWRAKRLLTALVYFIAFFLMSLIRSQVSDVSLYFLTGTLLGVPQVLFAFHMITDPMTSPQSKESQIYFGAAIGFLDAILRWNEVLNAPFLALLITCAMTPLMASQSYAGKTIFNIPNFKKISGLLFLSLLLLLAKSRGLLDISGLSHDLYAKSRMSNEKVSFSLHEVGSQAGIDHIFECFESDATNKNIIERLCRPNSMVVVFDYDNDGFQDILFSTMKEGSSNHLYRNLRNGKFENVTKDVGLDSDLNYPYPTTSILAFDYDNDGFEDLIIARAGCHSLYKNIDGKIFKDVSEKSQISKICSNATAINAFDYDSDGYLDLVIGNWLKGSGFKNLTEALMPEGGRNSQSGAPPIVLRNEEGKTFANVTKKLGLVAASHIWAIGVSDLDQDGHPDLFFANDHGSASLYKNIAGSSFKDISKESGVSKETRFAMNAEFGDFQNSGKMGLYVTDIAVPGFLISGNVLLENTEPIKFKNVAKEMDVNKCGWAWGAKFVDLDRDGWLDIFVTNGYWQGSREKSYYYPLMTLSSLPIFMQKNQKFHPRTDYFSNSADHENCIFQRQQDKYIDVSRQIGAADPAMGKGVALIDSENHGVMDILLSRSHGRPYFYKNSVENLNHWIGFKLVGTKSNRNAWGTRVLLKSKSGIQLRELFPANGFKSQSDSRVYFGIGKESDISGIDIFWPSGKKTILNKWKVDQYQKVIE